MKVFIPFILGIGFLHTVSAVTHSLKYFYTGVSGDINFPDFTIVGLVDSGQFVYYDSNTKRMVPKTEWMKEKAEPGYWDMESNKQVGLSELFKNNIQVLKDRFNQSMSTGLHVFQMMYGCEWDNETEVTGGLEQYGYDGEDFISLDLNTLTWIAPKPQAVITKNKWDNNKAKNEYLKNYYTQQCIDWLKKYLDYGKTSLMRAVPPSVSLHQKTPSSPVTCHATGFYPSRVMVTWQKDGQDHHEDVEVVEVGEILPNNDGTFQTSVHLNVNPEEWKKNKYQCVVQVSGIKEDFIKVLTEDEIRGVNDPTSTGPIIGVVIAGLLVITAVVIGVVIWKKKSKKGFVPANTSDDGSNSSNNTAPKA